MLISQRNQINRFVLDTHEVPDMILPIHQLKNVRSIDYDFLEKYIYWIDGKSGTIKRAYENGTSVRSVSFCFACNLISVVLITCITRERIYSWWISYQKKYNFFERIFWIFDNNFG